MRTGSSRTIIYEKSGRVARVTFNRPEVLNAINSTMLSELEDVVLDLRNDEAISIVVLTGKGRAFCVGQDLKESGRLDREASRREALRYATLASGIRSLDMVVIAAVNGYALAGGCELAMLADIVVASEDSSFGYPEARVGVLSGMGNFHILPRVVGEKKAKELFLVGEPIKAKAAERFGMVNIVVPAPELKRSVEGLVKKILRNAPLSVRYSKLATDYGTDSNFSATVAYETELLMATFQSEDYAEGAKAFVEKRKPRYRGR
ncbi:MAG: enoyl-CoA hydratase-related protein [Thaumarchaeota archaeon]|nr:enoyl-CoA hydratase-related protein [Nitrososphaerota archaeon]